MWLTIHISDMALALNTSALCAGLKINIGKSKILCLPSERPFDIVGQAIETISRFTYLASELAEYEGLDEDIEIRNIKALKSFDMM